MSGFTLDAIRDWCTAKGLSTQFNDELKQLAISRGEGKVPFRIIPRPENRMLTVALIVPGQAPVASFASVAQALVKANTRVFMGAWILAPSSGEIYFRVTIDAGREFTDPEMNYLLTVVDDAFERMGRRLWAVAHGKLAADDF